METTPNTTTTTTSTTPETQAQGTTPTTDTKSNPAIEKICELLKKMKLSDELIAKVKEELTKNMGSATTVSVEIEKSETPSEEKKDENTPKNMTSTLFPNHKSV